MKSTLSGQLPPLLMLLALLACGSPKTTRMGGSDLVELDLSDATVRMMPIVDSVRVQVHGVSVLVFEYLDYDVAKETAQQALRNKFLQYFLPVLKNQSKPTLQKFDDSLIPASFSKVTFRVGQQDSMTIQMPDGEAIAGNSKFKADFYLFVQNLKFDVREQLFYGRSRRVYLRVNFEYTIWDVNGAQVLKSGQVRLSERASFGVANGTFKPTFSNSTWDKILSKAAKLVLKDSPIAK